MPTPAFDIAALAERQLSDYDAGSPGMMFGEGVVLDEAAAYRVAAQVAQLRTARGERVIGYKVGCTSPVIRRQLGIDHCLFGRLYDTERHGDGVKLSAARFDHLAIEGELAVRLSVDLNAGVGLDDLLDGDFGAIFPVIELHN
jgi:2-keto-4-pentenoate hydratase